MILVDTDILIDVALNVEPAVNCLNRIEQTSTPAISAVTQMELIIGCRNKKEFRELEHFLKRFEILAINEEITRKAIELLKQYRLSHGLLIADGLIAATAMASDLQFVAKNQKDYRFIDDLKLLPYPKTFT